MLCQKITWVFVAVLCLTFRNVYAIEIACYVNDDNQCVFDSDVVWDEKEEFQITNSAELAEATTDIVLQAPFKTKVLPSAIFAKFSNLKSLTIVDVGLETIAVDDFKYATKLTTLNITLNNIPTLVANVFSLATKLFEINLSENHIITIEDGAFDGLPELWKLNLQGNKVVEFGLSMFVNIPKLNYLIVSHMDFSLSKPFEADEADKLTQLQSPLTKLDLSYNPIESTDLWKRLSIFPNLEMVYLTANKITHVDYMEEFTQLLPHVTEIYMGANPLEPEWLEEAKTFFTKAEIHFKYD